MNKESKFIETISSIIKKINSKKLKYKDNYNGYSNTNKKIAKANYIKKISKQKQRMFEGTKILEQKINE